MIDHNKILKDFKKVSRILECSMSSMNDVITEGLDSFKDKDTRDKLEILVSEIKQGSNNIDVQQVIEQANKIVADANTDTSN